MNETRVVAALWPVLGRHRGTIALLVCLGALASLCEGVGVTLFVPLLYTLGPDGFAGAPPGIGSVLERAFAGVAPQHRFTTIVAAMLALLLAKCLLTATDGWLFARLDARLLHQLRTTMFARLLRAPQSFFDRARAGELLQTLEGQSWDASGAVAKVIGIVIRLVTIAVFTTALLLLSWRLTLLVGALLVAVSALVRWLTRHAAALSEQGVRASEDVSQRALEVLRAIRTVRLFGREHDELERFRDASARASKVLRRVDSMQALVQPVSELLVSAVLIGVVFLTLRDPAGLPVVLTFLLVLYRLQPQVQRLDQARLQLAASSGAVAAVARFLSDELPQLRDGVEPCAGLRDAITFENVSHRYDAAAPWALRHATFKIAARCTTALVGASGAGKSTVLQLLLRLDDPTEGRIAIDGVELPRLDVASWRARCATVSQRVHLFHATVAENIAYGRPDASRQQIEDAARRAHAHEFVTALPRGYDTVIGDDGVSLSGGQRQRLALARALLRDPDVLVLDEATNALDSIAESIVNEALRAFRPGRTVILVTHRFTSLAGADHVVVLDGGEVREQGSPAELLAAGGLFARMHARQHADFAALSAPATPHRAP